MTTILTRQLLTTAALILALSFTATAKNDLFPFVISFDAPKNVTNISSQLDAPAGKDGFVQVKDGHFVTDKGRIQFWGTNTCFAANFLDHAAADRMADRLARFGINCVRLHHMDSGDIWGETWGSSPAKTKLTLDPKQLEKLDYYIAALKKRGIYVNINLHVSRELDERDGFPTKANRPSHDKGIDHYYRPLIDANKKYAKDLLEHVNPYTKTAYKDEPAVAMIEINNENSIIQMWGGWGGLDIIEDPFYSVLRKEWNDWLVKKYTDDNGLRKAWKARTVPYGDELLKNGDFSNGYVPDWKEWSWETDDKTDAPISNANGVLRMDVRKKGKVDWHPQLIASGFKVSKETLYTLEIKAKANQDTTLTTGLRMNHEPWEDLGFDAKMSLSTEWKTFSFVLTPSADDSNARIGIGGFQEGTVYEIDSVSFKPGGIVGLPKEHVKRLEMLKNGEFPKNYIPNYDGWNWEVDGNTDAKISNTDGVLTMDVRKKGDVDWHPQLSGGPFAVDRDKAYTIKLRAKANRNTSMYVGIRMNHEPWEGLGVDETADLSTEWKTFTFTFEPSETDSNARITLGGLEEGTTYEIDYVSIKPGKGDEPVKESSLARGSVPVIWKKDAGQYPKEAVDDFCDFLFDIEAKYWDEMYRFLKDEIKVKQPVSGTQLEYGSTHAQAKMDYCDIHAYWNHPHFPGQQWDGNNWYLHDRALVNYLDREILPSLATKRVYGKPFTMSEYNHPYPNRYAAEGLPLLAAFGAFQGWDGIFPFAYAHSNNPEPGMATSFFDTCGNTVQMAHMIACSTIFRERYNREADKLMVVAPLTVEKEREIFKSVRHPWGFGFGGLGLDPRIALIRPTAVDVFKKTEKNVNFFKEYPIAKDKKTFTTPTLNDVIEFDLSKTGKGVAKYLSPKVLLFTGFVTKGKEYDLGGNSSISFGDTNLGWATVSLTEVGKNSDLLVLTGEMRNTDMTIEELGDEKITVGNRWGKAPVRCEGIPATITFSARSSNVKCWALDESGNRKQEVLIQKTADGLKLDLKPEYKTIWYELETVK